MISRNFVSRLNKCHNFAFQIVFKAEKGRNDDFQMAIDDIFIKNSACGEPGNCNFNNDYCSYFMNDTSDFAWLLGTGRVVNTQMLDSSPVDNSVENGKFVGIKIISPVDICTCSSESVVDTLCFLLRFRKSKVHNIDRVHKFWYLRFMKPTCVIFHDIFHGGPIMPTSLEREILQIVLLLDYIILLF